MGARIYVQRFDLTDYAAGSAAIATLQNYRTVTAGTNFIFGVVGNEMTVYRVS